MKRVFKNLAVHWKTTVAGLYVGSFTCLLWIDKITVQEFALALGTIATIVGMLAKDWDKTNEK